MAQIDMTIMAQIDMKKAKFDLNWNWTCPCWFNPKTTAQEWSGNVVQRSHHNQSMLTKSLSSRLQRLEDWCSRTWWYRLLESGYQIKGWWICLGSLGGLGSAKEVDMMWSAAWRVEFEAPLVVMWWLTLWSVPVVLYG